MAGSTSTASSVGTLASGTTFTTAEEVAKFGGVGAPIPTATSVGTASTEVSTFGSVSTISTEPLIDTHTPAAAAAAHGGAYQPGSGVIADASAEMEAALHKANVSPSQLWNEIKTEWDLFHERLTRQTHLDTSLHQAAASLDAKISALHSVAQTAEHDAEEEAETLEHDL